jgi:hypothetical protein
MDETNERKRKKKKGTHKTRSVPNYVCARLCVQSDRDLMYLGNIRLAIQHQHTGEKKKDAKARKR